MQITSQTAHTLQLAEFRDHCRIPWTEDDPALQRSLDAAVLLWESATNWFVRQTVVSFDAYANMVIPGGPDPTIVDVFTVVDGANDQDVTASWFISNKYGVYRLNAKRSGSPAYSPHEEYIARIEYPGSLPASVKLGIYDWAHVLFRDRVGVEFASAVKMPLSLQSIITQHQRGIA